jgi:hypothetical protein
MYVNRWRGSGDVERKSKGMDVLVLDYFNNFGS